MVGISGAKADICFEVSFEVCNKVGGIYTVVSSKAEHMMKKYKEYYLFGPYFENKVLDEFEPYQMPEKFVATCKKLAQMGIEVYFGRWNIKGKPCVFLFDYKNFFSKEDELKKFYWDNFKIDSYGRGYDFSEPMIFATACGIFIELFKSEIPEKKAIVHCHEWISGFCGLYLKQKNVPVGTVFTTHATMLGRTMSGYDAPLYANLSNINPYDESYKANIQEKHLTEVACASNFDVFTTVSPITALECEKLLSKKPDVVLLNGLNVSKFPTFEEASIKHKLIREKIRLFNSYFFGPYQKVDYDNSLFFYTSGRYEYKNKGIDLLIKSLGKLNEELKKDEKSKTVYVYFLIPNGTSGVKNQIVYNKNKLSEIREYVNRCVYSIEEKLLRNIVNEGEVKIDTFFSEENKKEIEKLKREFHTKKLSPLLLTHNVWDEQHNAILSAFYANNLVNKQDDKVKVVYYPLYAEDNDGVFNLHYYELVSGFHLGVFPSYYEPFGYTPFESVALSVPAITSDLAGFGRFLRENDLDNEGVYVLDRMNTSFDDAANKLCTMMNDFISLDVNSRVDQKIKARDTATHLDWNILIEKYVEAHNLALEKRNL
ncbi:MAG: glycogen/starch synthase [Candidatus Woesearchaeota archaeon]|jgi:glycogen(starch) synthase